MRDRQPGELEGGTLGIIKQAHAGYAYVKQQLAEAAGPSHHELANAPKRFWLRMSRSKRACILPFYGLNKWSILLLRDGRHMRGGQEKTKKKWSIRVSIPVPRAC